MKYLALKLPNGTGNYEIFETDVGSTFKFAGKAPGDIINAFIPVLFALAGLVLFGMFISGGFTIFVSAGNPEQIKKGTGMITNGLVGFLIMFAAYWIIQLVEYSLGLTLL